MTGAPCVPIVPDGNDAEGGGTGDCWCAGEGAGASAGAGGGWSSSESERVHVLPELVASPLVAVNAADSGESRSMSVIVRRRGRAGLVNGIPSAVASARDTRDKKKSTTHPAECSIELN